MLRLGCGDAVRSAHAVVLAGGSGSRLAPLTFRRAKPVVPFGGPYRLIDFSLSNCLNSGIRRIDVLGQPGLRGLAGHVASWQGAATASGTSIRLLPPAGDWLGRRSTGTADAVRLYQLELRSVDPGLTLILAGDHVYSMDYRALLALHLQHEAPATVAACEVPLHTAGALGVMEVDRCGRVVRFIEKPAAPRPLPGQPERALASMGIYVFRSGFLFDRVSADAEDPASTHDFGRDILPRLVEEGQLMAVTLGELAGYAGPYWRDVGTIGSYTAAQMDMLETANHALLEDPSWPLGPPAVAGRLALPRHIRLGDCLVSEDCRLASDRVERSVLSPGVIVARTASVSDSILLPGVRVGAGASIRHAVVEEGLRVPAGWTIDGGIVSSQAELSAVPRAVLVPGGSPSILERRWPQRRPRVGTGGAAPRREGAGRAQFAPRA